MSGNVAAHQGFSKPFDALEELVKQLISDPGLWDAKVFRDSIHSFMPILREHLTEELTTLDAAELKKYITPKEFEEYEEKFTKEIRKNVSFMKPIQAMYVNGDSVNGECSRSYVFHHNPLCLSEYFPELMTTDGAQLYHCLPIPDGDWNDIYEKRAISMAMMHNAGKFNPGRSNLSHFSATLLK
ncbi:hypothetical protein FRC01_012231 [Tulasnella sp. 417]|nr:hypothetical protein FRC01_012231 [Tulasnella sp. 417]